MLLIVYLSLHCITFRYYINRQTIACYIISRTYICIVLLKAVLITYTHDRTRIYVPNKLYFFWGGALYFNQHHSKLLEYNFFFFQILLTRSTMSLIGYRKTSACIYCFVVYYILLWLLSLTIDPPPAGPRVTRARTIVITPVLACKFISLVRPSISPIVVLRWKVLIRTPYFIISSLTGL